MGKYVIGIGEALWDVLPEGKKLGGAPANFAYHARQFGLEGIAMSAIGHDALGEEVADTVGAGDSFTGAFIGSILQGKSVAVAHETAVRVSAYVCTQQGAVPVVPEELKG